MIIWEDKWVTKGQNGLLWTETLRGYFRVRMRWYSPTNHTRNLRIRGTKEFKLEEESK